MADFGGGFTFGNGQPFGGFLSYGTQPTFNPVTSPSTQTGTFGTASSSAPTDFAQGVFDKANGATNFGEAVGAGELSDTAKEIAAQTQAMLAEQRAFQFLMAKIKNDHSMRQAFITALRQQATDNKNSFN